MLNANTGQEGMQCSQSVQSFCSTIASLFTKSKALVGQRAIQAPQP